MIIRVCFFTEAGKQKALELFEKLHNFTPFYFEREKDDFKDWLSDSFRKHLPILFVGACGIAVREIAPFVKDKLSDSPVLVMDEKGEFIIPILSGHMGGANELARIFSDAISATSVITTATDVRGKFSVDVFARLNGFNIADKKSIAKVSKKVLSGEKIIMAVEDHIEIEAQDIPAEIELFRVSEWKRVNDKKSVDVLVSDEEKIPNTLWLVPKHMVFGVGCKKGKTFEELENFWQANAKAELAQLFGIFSIDIKKNETGLMEAAQFFHVPFITFSAEDLAKVEGEFCESTFVESKTGVSNVCERAAVLGSENGKLIKSKTAENGMTLAVAYRKAKIIKWQE